MSNMNNDQPTTRDWFNLFAFFILPVVVVVSALLTHIA